MTSPFPWYTGLTPLAVNGGWNPPPVWPGRPVYPPDYPGIRPSPFPGIGGGWPGSPAFPSMPSTPQNPSGGPSLPANPGGPGSIGQFPGLDPNLRPSWRAPPGLPWRPGPNPGFVPDPDPGAIFPRHPDTPATPWPPTTAPTDPRPSPRQPRGPRGIPNPIWGAIIGGIGAGAIDIACEFVATGCFNAITDWFTGRDYPAATANLAQDFHDFQRELQLLMAACPAMSPKCKSWAREQIANLQNAINRADDLARRAREIDRRINHLDPRRVQHCDIVAVDECLVIDGLISQLRRDVNDAINTRDAWNDAIKQFRSNCGCHPN